MVMMLTAAGPMVDAKNAKIFFLFCLLKCSPCKISLGVFKFNNEFTLGAKF